MTKKKAKVGVGSVSSGTLLPEDLLAAFSQELRELLGEDSKEFDELLVRADSLWELLTGGYSEGMSPEAICELQDDADIVVGDLEDALQEFAPPYMYFGSCPGDGADFGWWVDDDAIREGSHSGEILEVKDLPDFLLMVSDHGNCTLYRIVLEEVWGIV